MYQQEYIATEKEIKKMNRKQLIDYLENARGIACYDDESTDLLRECALEDAGIKYKENPIDGNEAWFTSRQQQIDTLIDFINQRGEWAYEYNTQHEDAGGNYFEAMALNDSLETYTKYRDLSENNKELLKFAFSVFGGGFEALIFESGELKSTHGIHTVFNEIESVGVGEIHEQLSGIEGTINGKHTNDIFETLKSGLTEKELRKVASDVDYYWDGKSDYIAIDCSHDRWSFIIDEDELWKNIKREEVFSDKIKFVTLDGSMKADVYVAGQSYLIHHDDGTFKFYWNFKNMVWDLHEDDLHTPTIGKILEIIFDHEYSLAFGLAPNPNGWTFTFEDDEEYRDKRTDNRLSKLLDDLSGLETKMLKHIYF